MQNLSQDSNFPHTQKASLVDSSIEEAFNRLTRLARHALKVPASLVSLVDEQSQFLKSQASLGKPIIINDSRTEELVVSHKVETEISVIAYLGIPLRLKSGVIFGTLCAIDDKPKEWTSDDIEILSTLASSAVSEIDLRLSHQNFDETIKKISHDLKNPISAIQLSAQMMTRNLHKQTQTQDIKRGLDKILALTKKMNFIVMNLHERATNSLH